MVDLFVSEKNEEKKKTRVSIKQIKEVIGEGGREGIFTSFARFPRKVNFERQTPGEEVVLFLRQHPIVNLGWVVLVVALLTVPSFFEFFPPFTIMPTTFRFVVVLLWYLLVLGFALVKLMNWFFNIYIVTDERLIDADFESLFIRRISETKTENIEDVSSEMKGALQVMFSYGDVYFQTAAEVPQFEFHNVPSPDLVAKYISQLVDLEEQEKLEGRVK